MHTYIEPYQIKRFALGFGNYYSLIICLPYRVSCN